MTNLMHLAEDYAPLDIDLSSPAPTWKPKAVMLCMVEAFETLRRIPGSVGPKRPGSGWPAIVRELGEEYAMPPADNEYRLPLSKAQISRMEEVLAWPVRFLGGNPKASDALCLWAMCKAMGWKLDPILQQRARKAADLSLIRQRQVDADLDAALTALEEEVNNWAETKYAGGMQNEERADAIRANARIRFDREVEGRKLVPRMVDPAECSPDRVITRDSLDWQRNVAARTIAEGLAGRKISSRQPQARSAY